MKLYVHTMEQNNKFEDFLLYPICSLLYRCYTLYIYLHFKALLNTYFFFFKFLDMPYTLANAAKPLHIPRSLPY